MLPLNKFVDREEDTEFTLVLAMLHRGHTHDKKEKQ
jgi:hypothetical protein